MEQIIRQRKLSEIGEVLINQKKETGYAQSSIRICENELERLRVFMEHEGDELYCIDVGARYLATDYCNKTALRHSKCKSFISQLNDCMLYGRYTLYHLDKKTASTPGRFTGIEEKYISWCREKGNGSVTLWHEHLTFARFFSLVESIGVMKPQTYRLNPLQEQS